MEQLQKSILSMLKENKKPMSISNIALQLNTKNEYSIITEIDLLNNSGFVDIHRSTGGRIKRVSINQKGIEYFSENSKVQNKQEIQLKIEELKAAIETINQALDASTPEEKKALIDKENKVISVLKDSSQLASFIFNVLKNEGVNWK
jgi:repressor of nif and glnA expression